MAKLDTLLAAAIGWLTLSAATPSMAASAAASSASQSIGFSVGALSGSIQKSSGSSSRATDVAEGEYQVTEAVAVAGQPGTVRLRLHALAETGTEGEVFLLLPQAAVDRIHLVPGCTVVARQRPYGLEFADGRTQQAFFLVLGDDWVRELKTEAVEL